MFRLPVWPRSLVGRVCALYSSSLIVFVFGGLALFYRYEFGLELESAQRRADALIAVAAPAVSDSAVIGDYDAIQRTLDRAMSQSDFASASFIDVKGATLQAALMFPPDVRPPTWLSRLVAARIFDANEPIVVGGHDYGVLRLRLAPDRIASSLWRQLRAALGLALMALAGGLLLVFVPLKRSIASLGAVNSLDEWLVSGRAYMRAALQRNAPIEFRQTFDALNQAAVGLQTQRQQAAVTLEAITDEVLTLDALGHVMLANPAACAALGIAQSEVLGKRAHELMPAVFADTASYVPWRGRRVSVAMRDGSRRVLDTTMSAIKDDEGALRGHVLACRDVTEQHMLHERLEDQLYSRQMALEELRGVLEGLVPNTVGDAETGDDIAAISRLISGLVRRLKEHSELLNATFTLSPDGFVSFGPTSTIDYVSPAFTGLTGLYPDDVLGLREQAFVQLLTSRCNVEGMPAFDTLREGENASSRQDVSSCRIDIAKPAPRTLVLTHRPGDGATLAQILHFRDVTRETEVERMKSAFLSMAAHELRTPMTSIYGFIELLMHRRLTPERQKEVVETVHRQSGLMISIVNELLDLARIEARRGADFVLERIDVGAFVAEAIRDFKAPSERASPRPFFPETQAFVRADRGKLSQALGNVLSNAYKYSPGGGDVDVVVSMSSRSAESSVSSHVAITVQDRGIGMTPDQLAHMGERFYRVDASGAIPGTGLGVSIVKEIVELLGGEVRFDSAVGEGTAITLRLPRSE